MDDALLVRSVEGVGDLCGDGDRFRDGQSLAAAGVCLDQLLQRLSLDELEDERGRAEGVLDPVDRADVRVVEGRQESRLPLEAGEALGVACERVGERLHRDVAAEPPVARAVDLTHATGADLLDDHVGTDACSGIHASAGEERFRA